MRFERNRCPVSSWAKGDHDETRRSRPAAAGRLSTQVRKPPLVRSHLCNGLRPDSFATAFNGAENTNENQGVLAIGLFVLTILLGWTSGIFKALRRKPDLKMWTLPRPTFACVFGTGRKHNGYDAHSTGIALYLRISNSSDIPSLIRRKEMELNSEERKLANFIDFIGEGRGSRALSKALEETECKVDILQHDLEGLHLTRKRLFQTPPIE